MLLDEAYQAEPDFKTANNLGHFFVAQFKCAHASDLKKDLRKSAIKWYSIALDLYEQDENKEKSRQARLKWCEARNLLSGLLDPGSREHFDFLNKYREYVSIISNWELFRKQGIVTASLEEANEQLLHEMREAKFKTETDLGTVNGLGHFFAERFKDTDNRDLKEAYRESAVRWYNMALDLYEQDEDREKSHPGGLKQIGFNEARSGLRPLLVRGTHEHFDFLQKYHEYGLIVSGWELFRGEATITASLEELHTQWLSEMREAKLDSAVKRRCALGLLNMYSTYPVFSSLFPLSIALNIPALKKECQLVAHGRILQTAFGLCNSPPLSRVEVSEESKYTCIIS